MSQAAAEYLQEIQFFEPGIPVDKKCEPHALVVDVSTSLSRDEAKIEPYPIEVHTVRHRNTFHLQRSLVKYFEEFLPDRIPDTQKQCGGMRVNKYLPSNIREEDFVKTMLGKKVITGKLSDFAIEAVGRDDLPQRLTRTYDRSRDREIHYISDINLYFRLIGKLQMGSISTVVGSVIQLLPYRNDYGWGDGLWFKDRLWRYPNGAFRGEDAAELCGKLALLHEYLNMAKPYQGGRMNPR